jgi:UDP-N-acetylglucosamine 2-epimerase
MKVLSILGARPQFIKAAPVSAALRTSGHTERIVHTGQHYDYAMSEVFFEELDIALPDRNLGVGSGPHGRQTAQMLERIEEELLRVQPDWVIVYGDTNSTLAGALAASKLGTPLAHVEAGLRSYNRSMPEEHNRVLTDHCADLLLCPTETAMRNLTDEGLGPRGRLVGDTMYDILLQSTPRINRQLAPLAELDLVAKEYLLATLHRPYNVDDPGRLQRILGAFGESGETVILPVHPRTRQRLQEDSSILDGLASNVRLIDPVSYVSMLRLEKNARLILTDSGGVQKEAYLLAVPCVTLRPETEWVETVQAGWNVVVDADPSEILAAVARTDWPDSTPPPLFGDGAASQRIVRELEGWLEGAANHG